MPDIQACTGRCIVIFAFGPYVQEQVLGIFIDRIAEILNIYGLK
jgi:hypothetical protein